MDLTEAEFDELVGEAVRLIPPEFAPYLENVQFLVDEEAGEPLRRRLGLGPDAVLFGLYTGTPLLLRPHDFAGFPDRITIFRRPLLERSGDRDALRTQVVRTVLHEVAHHFGIGEARLAELGYG